MYMIEKEDMVITEQEFERFLTRITGVEVFHIASL